MKIVINSIRYDNSLVDGPGIRTDLFLQGCDIHCPGCQNQSTWDIAKGKEIEIDDLVFELKSKMRSNKITITGEASLTNQFLKNYKLNVKYIDEATYVNYVTEHSYPEFVKIEYSAIQKN